MSAFTLANLTRNFRNPSKLRGTPTRPLDAVGGEGVCRVGEESHPRTTLTAQRVSGVGDEPTITLRYHSGFRHIF